MNMQTRSSSVRGLQRTSAFTLIELMVSISIIVVLVSLLIPAVLHAYRTAMRARIAADFQTITMALEAYKQDFGDIPRLPTNPVGSPSPLVVGNPVTNTGAAALGKALLGPYGDGLLPDGVTNDQADPPTFQAAVPYHAGDCVASPAGTQWLTVVDSVGVTPVATDPRWQYFTATDNADGPGFRVRKGAAKVWGPYIQPGKVKNEGVNLLDANGSPILYFPAHVGAIDVTKDAGTSPDQLEPYVSLNPYSTPSPAVSLYDASDNIQAFYRTGEVYSAADDGLALNRIRLMMGNYSLSGFVDSTKGDTAINQPYLLWSAGPDGLFGPTGYTPIATDPSANQKAVAACDDVTNFR